MNFVKNSQKIFKRCTGKPAFLLLFLCLQAAAACTIPRSGRVPPTPTENSVASPAVTVVPSTTPATPTTTQVATIPQPSQTPSGSPTSTSTPKPTPTSTEIAFKVGNEITVEYLRALEITGSEITFHQELPDNNKYHRHIVSYQSEGNRIYGLLTLPLGDPPQGGYKAIVFNHGYIPPDEYQTTERYGAYIDYLARSGFVVFKIDYRGHGESEGQPTGTYFSPAYTIDAVAALKSLQTMDIIDPQGIGMWGHSMAGNLVLRAMLIEPEVQAGVIWSGAIYSYVDFVKYGISDNSYRPPPTPEDPEEEGYRRRSREIFETHGRPESVSEYWQAVSLTEHIESLNSPLQLHHAEDDPVVNIGYSTDLVDVLQQHDKEYQFFSYQGGGHNLASPYFDQAMIRTVQFFRDHL